MNKQKTVLSILVLLVSCAVVISIIPRPASAVVGLPPPNAKVTNHIGNPHDFKPGPPIPSCNAHPAGPPDDPIRGCKATP